MLDDRFRSALGLRAGDEEVVCELVWWVGGWTVRWESGILGRLSKSAKLGQSEERVLSGKLRLKLTRLDVLVGVTLGTLNPARIEVAKKKEVIPAAGTRIRETGQREMGSDGQNYPGVSWGPG